MDFVYQTQYDDLRWDWDSDAGEYKKNDGGDADKPKCGMCEATLPWDYAMILGY